MKIVPAIASLMSTAGLVLCLAACTPPPPKQVLDDEAALRAEKGYVSAPRITGVTRADPGMITISGQAQPDNRVAVLYNDSRPFAVTADSKGRYRADVPIGASGGLYDISSIEASGREMHADGRLFVPPGAEDRAILLRTGAPSTAVSGMKAPLAVIDFDGAGALIISGRVAPGVEVEVSVDGGPPATVTSDAGGVYHVKGQVSSPEQGAEITLNVRAGTTEVNRTILFSVPESGMGDHVAAVEGGWRLDWTLPGGGMQSAIVY